MVVGVTIVRLLGVTKALKSFPDFARATPSIKLSKGQLEAPVHSPTIATALIIQEFTSSPLYTPTPSLVLQSLSPLQRRPGYSHEGPLLPPTSPAPPHRGESCSFPPDHSFLHWGDRAKCRECGDHGGDWTLLISVSAGTGATSEPSSPYKTGLWGSVRSQDGGKSGLSQDWERPACSVCTQARLQFVTICGRGGRGPKFLTAVFSPAC